jgi:formylglycine-generating enzyme required for sulfatase activity
MPLQPDAALHAEALQALSDALRSLGWRLDAHSLARVTVIVRRAAHLPRAAGVRLITAALAAPDRQPDKLQPHVQAWAAAWWPDEVLPEDHDAPPPVLPPPLRRRPPPRPTGWAWSDVDPGAWGLIAACGALLVVAVLLPSAPDQPVKVDADGDGVPPPADCDDTDPAKFPGNVELPGDGVDQDCDGQDTVTPSSVSPPPPPPQTLAIQSPTAEVRAAPSKVAWAALTVLAAAVLAAVAAWRWLGRGRLLSFPPVLPDAAPLRVHADREVLLLDPPHAAAAARQAERHQLHEPSTRLHAERTVEATARAAGIPSLRWRQRPDPLGAWIWQQQLGDPEADRLAADLHAALTAAGLPVQTARFHTVPDALNDGRERRHPATANESEQAAWVLVLQRCEDLLDWLDGRRHSAEGVQLLRAMAAFPSLTVVGFGDGIDQLQRELRPFGLRVVPAEDLLDVVTGQLDERDLPAADLHAWQEALAVLPGAVSHADALRLRRHLHLDVSALLWSRFAPARAGLTWSAEERARHVARLRHTAAQPDRLRAAIAWWRDTLTQRADPDDAVTLALLDAWDRPDDAARRLTALAPEHGARIRRALRRSLPADVLPKDGEGLALLWRAVDHAQAYATLRGLGLGADAFRQRVTTVHPGRRWLGAMGLAGLALAALAQTALSGLAAHPDPVCLTDADVACRCTETTCVALSRDDIQVFLANPGESVQVSLLPREADCIEHRGALTLRRCTTTGARAPSPGERRPRPSAWWLEGGTVGDGPEALADLLLASGTADVVLTGDVDAAWVFSTWRITFGTYAIGDRRSVPVSQSLPQGLIRACTDADCPGLRADSWTAMQATLASVLQDTTLKRLTLDTLADKVDFTLVDPALADTPVLRAPTCGDGTTDPGERCDDGPANSDTAPNACRTDCQLPRCGDAVTDEGEACDGPGCRPDCSGPISCGDGVVDAGEDCDEGPVNHDGEPGACNTRCRVETCGDGVVQAPEGCDLGAANGQVRALGCRADCTPIRCGDGVLDAPLERCDAGAANSDTAPGACRTTCQPARCGDGVTDPGEACDGGPGCTPTCEPLLTACGDGRLDAGEQCDLGEARNLENLDCTPACRLPKVEVAGGKYRIGAEDGSSPTPADDETPPWTLVTAAFEVQRTEVTQALYAQVMGGEPSTSKRPAAGVAWADAEAFCNRVGGRLPTEAEWEAAARSIAPRGATYLWGDDASGAARVAHVGTGRLADVGSTPDLPAILDLAGNAWEWTSDCWDPDIYPDRARGLVGVDSPRNTRCADFDDGMRQVPGAYILRGGSALMPTDASRLANRLAESRTRPRADAGFRCVWGGNPRDDDGLRWVHVPAGPHWIGAVPGDSRAEPNESPAWQATFTGGFNLLATEVTVAHWGGFGARADSDDLPKADVNWFDAAKFCEAHGARLPTEVEFEAALRGGTRTVYPCGDDTSCLPDIAWPNPFGSEPHPVATRRPNPWGLYDLSGNVVEWTADCYAKDAWNRLAPDRVATDPGISKTTTCEERVFRGSGFWGEPWWARSSVRFRDAPWVRRADVGFRCVRDVRRP